MKSFSSPVSALDLAATRHGFAVIGIADDRTGLQPAAIGQSFGLLGNLSGKRLRGIGLTVFAAAVALALTPSRES
jgi:hypothetical protein